MSARTPRRVPVDERIGALTDAVSACGGKLSDEALARAEAALERASDRRAHGEGLVVVALAGGTGTGKSSLFNVLSGEDLAEVDVMRPTTSDPAAWVVADTDEAGPLLDWLEVPVSRRFHAAEGGGPEGLVLLDLPDIDSVETANRRVAARLAARVDVLVWVVDPHKYAQATLHDGYLADLVEHAEVMHVVLNQVDRLSPAEASVCLDDLRCMVGGRHGPPVLAISVTTGAGIDRLTAAIHREVTDQRAVGERIAADVRSAAAELSEHLASPGEPGRGQRPRQVTDELLDPAALTSALAELAGIEDIAGRARTAYLDAARAATRSAVLRVVTLVVGALGVAAGLGRAAARSLGLAPSRTADRRLPTATSHDVQHVLGRLAAEARQQLPWPWAARIHDVTSQVARELPTALKAAMAPLRHRPARRRWWAPVAWVVTAAELVALIGAAWLLVSGITARSTLPSLPVVMLDDEVSLAGAMVAAGLVVWLVLVLVRELAIRVGANGHRRAAARAAHAAVGDAVDSTAIAPLRDELDTYARVHEALARASA